MSLPWSTRLKRMRPKRRRAKAKTSRRKRQRTKAKRRRPKRLRKRRRPRRAQKKPAAAQAEIEYFFGYDNEFRKAWRAPSSKPDARESCPNKLQIPDGAADSDHPVAVWDDMPKPVPITCLTVGQVKAMEADQKPKGVIWEHKFEDGRHRK